RQKEPRKASGKILAVLYVKNRRISSVINVTFILKGKSSSTEELSIRVFYESLNVLPILQH
uniref:Uncharacterized protein n=1 Tax=Cyprinus carpio TaxID=7962 RepID=A0A8C1R9X5_CYPCA